MATGTLRNWFTQPDRPRVIVLGNEKGGSGKSTTAMHLIVGLMQGGHRVASIDLDGRQATLSHYLAHRRRFAADAARAARAEPPPEMPDHRRISPASNPDQASARNEETRHLAAAIEALKGADYIVIDTPGNDSYLSRIGHVMADILITPMNDSFLDLDVIARTDLDGGTVLGPSVYCEMLMDRWRRRRALGGEPPDWIVLRNRLAQLESRNQRRMTAILADLAPRIGFRLADGLSERVIFRELFSRGLTVLDPPGPATPWFGATGTSHAAAADEVHRLLSVIGLPAAGAGSPPVDLVPDLIGDLVRRA